MYTCSYFFAVYSPMLIQVKQDKTNLPKNLYQGLPKSGLQHSNDKRDCGWHHHDPHVVYQQFFPAFLAVLLPHEDISLLQFTGLCGTLFFRQNSSSLWMPCTSFTDWDAPSGPPTAHATECSSSLPWVRSTHAPAQMRPGKGWAYLRIPISHYCPHVCYTHCMTSIWVLKAKPRRKKTCICFFTLRIATDHFGGTHLTQNSLTSPSVPTVRRWSDSIRNGASWSQGPSAVWPNKQL